MQKVIMLFSVLLLMLASPTYSWAKINARIVRTMPVAMEVLKGNIPGHSFVHVNGHNPDVGTSSETVWAEGGVVSFPTSSSTMTVSSSDVDDTSAGSGVRTVEIKGLSGGVELTEIITLNGQTAVTTVNSFERINFMKGLTAGATGSNEGIVYIGTGTVTAGKPAAVVNLMEAATNMSSSGFFTVPIDRTAFLIQVISSAEGNKVAMLEAFSRRPGGLFTLQAGFNLFNAVMVITSMVPSETIPSGTDVELRAMVTAGSGDIRTSCIFILVDNTAL